MTVHAVQHVPIGLVADARLTAPYQSLLDAGFTTVDRARLCRSVVVGEVFVRIFDVTGREYCV